MAIIHFPTTAPSPETPAPRASCVHRRLRIGPFDAEWCPRTDELSWKDAGEPIDPAVALARLFGEFDLVSVADGLHAPGTDVFIYRPSNRTRRTWMRSLPRATWLGAAPGLWLTHDDRHLLMSPDDPVLSANLKRGSR